MISYLKGKVLLKQEESFTLLVGDVGYEVFCPDTSEISEHKNVELFIYTHVREDSLQLFGFKSLKQKEIFIQMIKKVSGIGPKVALKILSHVSLDTFISLVSQNQIKELSKLPKVGRKKAEQIVICLKDRLKSHSQTPQNTLFKEAFLTLQNLGFYRSEIEKALEKINNKDTLEGIVKEALFIINSSKELVCNKKDSLQVR